MFAAWHLGAALTPVNPALTDDEVLYQLQDSASRVLVGDARAGELAGRTALIPSPPTRCRSPVERRVGTRARRTR